MNWFEFFVGLTVGVVTNGVTYYLGRARGRRDACEAAWNRLNECADKLTLGGYELAIKHREAGYSLPVMSEIARQIKAGRPS